MTDRATRAETFERWSPGTDHSIGQAAHQFIVATKQTAQSSGSIADIGHGRLHTEPLSTQDALQHERWPSANYQNGRVHQGKPLRSGRIEHGTCIWVTRFSVVTSHRIRDVTDNTLCVEVFENKPNNSYPSRSLQAIVALCDELFVRTSRVRFSPINMERNVSILNMFPLHAQVYCKHVNVLLFGQLQ